MTCLFSQLAMPLAFVVLYTLLATATTASAASTRAFSFGWNRFGQTGLGIRNDESVVAARPIDASNLDGRNITQVAAGDQHSLLLAEDGSVFSFGSNNGGQTGLGRTDSPYTPYTLVATPIVRSNLGARAIKQVAAGGDFSLLLAEDGSVFSCGWNDQGITGLGTGSGLTLVATPIDASNLGGRAIVQVAAGGYHSLLLAEDGSVFSFGSNGSGQTGLGTTLGTTLVATPIDASNLGGKAISKIAAGSYYSLLLAEDGSVFSFGDNTAGQTGLGTESGMTRVATPIDSSNLGARAITQLSAGSSHSLLLDEDGNVFSFGDNLKGQTGLGTTSGHTLVATPINVSNLGGQTVLQMDGGLWHSLLVVLVPEPGALALAGVALFGLLGFARRSR